MVMWVCEAWQVNIWTVFAVRPNGPNNKNKTKNNFASSRSDHLGSDKKGDKDQLVFRLVGSLILSLFQFTVFQLEQSSSTHSLFTTLPDCFSDQNSLS